MTHRDHNAPLPPLSELHGIGPTRVQRLASLGLTTVRDLVMYFPRTHEDRTHVVTIVDLVVSAKNTIRARIDTVRSRRSFHRKLMTIIEARVADDTGDIKIVWFNQPYLAQSLRIGEEYMFTGVVKQTRNGLQMASPVHEKIDAHKMLTHTGRIVPLYALTAGITQNQMRYFVKQALERVLPCADYLPASIRAAAHLLPLSDALRNVHFPQTAEKLTAAQRRCDFDKLYVLQLLNMLSRASFRTQQAPVLLMQTEVIKKFVAALPFTLTNAQRKCAWTIVQELAQSHPMNRLLSGDVGSGKTIVAGIAILNTLRSDYQAAVLVPTAVLAEQHYHTFQKLFAPTNVSIQLCTSKTKQDNVMNAQLVIGTHAIIQERVQFQRLGLAVIDEQHLFGVAQRKRLKEASGSPNLMPHLLSMTATPIPRTLALALFGDLDLSIIDEMPKNRKPILTRVVPPQKRAAAYNFLREHMRNHQQVFVICPLIEESEMLAVKSVTKEFARLSTEIFPDFRLAMLHGKMKQREKETIMQAMRLGNIDMLVATSVVEVGVDIPGATIMVIEAAERFGLAQLHQFRGRVGRNDQQSYCFLFTDAVGGKPLERLAALIKSHNGFELAEHDLALRGAGTLYGTIQSGFGDYALDLFAQPRLLADVQIAAKQTIAQNLLARTPLLRKKLQERLDELHLE